MPVVPTLPDLDPGATVLGAVELSSSLPEEKYEKAMEKFQPRLGGLSLRAREAGLSSVLVFEGWDAAGKGGAIRRLTHAMDASDYRVVPIAAPSEEEKAHHYLWRFWRHLPPPGTMLIFDRSWYGRVLVERVEGFARADEWKRAYGEIVDFEEQLAEHGIPVLKFWLHLDPEEQARRFAAREVTGYKKYKITSEDYRNREKWDEYVAAVDEAVARTSTEFAPWHLVAANDKRWARREVLRITCRALERALEARR
jgi:polyphosphate kinase 2 (PPK2 family)